MDLQLMYLEHDYFKVGYTEVGLALRILNRTGDIYKSILLAEKRYEKYIFQNIRSDKFSDSFKFRRKNFRTRFCPKICHAETFCE